MQTKIASYGGPLGHNVAIDYDGTGVTINFLGELQSADTLSRTVERRYEHQPIRGIGCERCEVLPRSRVAVNQADLSRRSQRRRRKDGFGRQQNRVVTHELRPLQNWSAEHHLGGT